MNRLKIYTGITGLLLFAALDTAKSIGIFTFASKTYHFPNKDFIGHFVLAAITYGMLRWISERWLSRLGLSISLITFLIIIEQTHRFLDTRSYQVSDIIAGILGIGLAITLEEMKMRKKQYKYELS